jgi:hypothetical protein
VKGNSIYFSILGTNENPKKSVIISNKILSETPFTVQTTVDPTLPPGTTKELQEGLNGYVVETFKTIKEDGKVISQTKLHTSRYNPCTQILLVGPAPVEENTVPGPDNNTPPADNNTTPGETTPPMDSNNEPAADEIIPPSNEDTTPQIPGNTAEPSVEEMPEGQEIID